MIRRPSRSSASPLALVTILAVAALPLRAQDAPAAAPEARMAADLDLIEADGPQPVFVRMRDQLLPDADAWDRFVAAHATTPRRELRPTIRADLQTRAAASWDAIAATVRELQDAGHVGAELERFWIVNGFATTADADAVRRLAAHDAVGYVHRQRQPGRLDQHEFRSLPEAARARGERALESLLGMRSDGEPAFDPDAVAVPWNLQRIRAPEAWHTGAVGQGVTIAMIDSGLLPIEPVARALWQDPREEPNGTDDDGDGFVDERCGWDAIGDTPFAVGDGPKSHGTMCAGILVGRESGEDRFTTGVAPRARLMVLRGGGRLRAYEFLASHEADVLSMSFMWIGFDLGSYRSVLRTAHEHLAACGVVAVGGAGNFGRSAPEGRQIAFPKDIPCVIAAAGVVESGEVPPFSSRGPVTWDLAPWYADHPAGHPLEKPDVSGCIGGFPVWHRLEMPGRGVEVFRKLDGGFGLIVGPRGNSFSGPHAGGVAALMLSAAPDLNVWDVQRLMRETCTDLLDDGWDPTSGAGLLQADAAVAAARALATSRRDG